MKRIGLILSMLFCITAFANNSYADCPAITTNYEFRSMPVKILAYTNDYYIMLIPQPFEYNKVCVAPVVFYSATAPVLIGMMANYPTGTSTNTSNAGVSQMLEVCSEDEAYQMLQNPTVYATLLNQSYEESPNLRPVGNNLLVAILGNTRQRCPITCEAGTVLYKDFDGGKSCQTCESEGCCLTEETTYTLSDYKEMGDYLCPVSGGSGNNNTPARSPLRVAAATHNAGENALVSAAYARGAYNANVANINNAIEYVEDSSIATINSAKVSADNVSLSVNGFTPSGTVSVNSSNATVSGTFNVPTTVALMDEWGATTTTNATLGGIQQANITNGGISGLSATFTGTASGNLSGTGSFSNASVHVDGWKPVNSEQ